MHNLDYLTEPPQTWHELIDQAQQLIVFVAVPPPGPTGPAPVHMAKTRKWSNNHA